MTYRLSVRPPDALSIYVVYSDPSDYPGKFVVREHYVLSTGTQAVANVPCFVGETLKAARDAVPRGLFLFRRHPGDDPKIVETWL